MRISDWSSDVCSSDLAEREAAEPERGARDREQDDRRSRAHPKVRFHQGCHCRDSFLEPLPFRGGVGVGALGVAQGRWPDRQSGAWGKSGSVRVYLGGRRIIKKKTQKLIVTKIELKEK